MNLASLGSFQSTDVGSLFGGAIRGTTATAPNSNARIGAPTGGQYSDNSQLSPLAQVLGTLQQAQQSSPGQFQQLAKVIAASLQEAAQQLGNSPLTSHLSQLATAFTNAANTGGLPNISDLANAIGRGSNQGSGSYGGGFEVDSLSIQVSFSEVSTSTSAQTATAQGGVGSQTAQQQSQESALLYQFNLTETSISYANQDSSQSGGVGTANQLSAQAAKQLLALIQQSFEKAAQSVQGSGNSAEAKLLKQLEEGFSSALTDGGQTSNQSPTNNNGSSATGPASGPIVPQQLQGSLQAYQINFSESYTSITTNQQLLALA